MLFRSERGVSQRYATRVAELSSWDWDAAQYDVIAAIFIQFATPAERAHMFAGICRALKPGGRMVHIVWRNRADNPWLSMAKDIVLRFLPQPGADALTCGPGPFSMSDEATVRTMMKAAGYEDIVFRRVDAPVLVGKDVDDAIAFQLAKIGRAHV